MTNSSAGSPSGEKARDKNLNPILLPLRAIRRLLSGGGARDAALSTQSVMETTPPVAEQPALAPPRALSDWDLVSLLPLDAPNRVYLTGFPGAGSVVVQHLCLALLRAAGVETDQVAVRGANIVAARPLTAYISPRYDETLQLLRSALPTDWTGESYFHNLDGARMDFYASDGKRFLSLAGLEIGVQFNTPVHSTHEPPSRRRCDYYAASGFRILPVVRHPLDILVSFLFKTLDGPTRAAIKSADRQEAPLLLRRFASERGFLDARFLVAVSDALRRFYEPVAQFADQWPPLRYEDALGDPGAFVAALASRLQLTIEPAAAEAIRRMIGHVELSPGHLNAPSIGKWRYFLSREHIEFLGAAGLFAPFITLGYPDPRHDDPPAIDEPGRFSAVTRQPPRPAEVIAALGPALTESFWALADGRDPLAFARRLGVADAIHTLHQGRLLLFGDDKEFLAAYSQKLTAAVLAKMP